MVRETILEGLTQEVVELGSLDFSIADVAKRAGVSHRTVYNHFGSRQDLVEAFAIWIEAEVYARGGITELERLEDLPDAVAVNFQIFEDKSDVAEVLAQMDRHERATSAHERRTATLVGVVAEAYPNLSDREHEMIAALMRQIASVRNWYQLTREFGLSVDEAATMSGWTLEQLISAIDRGELPRFDSHG